MGVLAEKIVEVTNTIEIEQTRGEKVADAQVVAGVEAQQVTPVGEGFIGAAALPQGAGQAGTGAQIGTGGQAFPAMTALPVQGLRAKVALGGFDTQAVEHDRLKG